MAGPGRPSSDKTTLQYLNGSPVFLGVLVSTGAAVNNSTTATPFNSSPLGTAVSGASPPINLTNTLAGKMLLLQTTAAGLILPAGSATLTIVQQATSPVMSPPYSHPGVALASGERAVILMLQGNGWLQWLPVTGSANCLVWELL